MWGGENARLLPSCERKRDNPDEEGVEVSRVEDARAEALKVVREAQGNGAALRESAGWWLEARDDGGALLFSFDLGGSG